MAKRRTEKDEEVEKPFKFPKFDEQAFIKKEKRNIKATFISFLFGCLLALICFGFWALMGHNSLRWPLILLLAVASASFIKYLFIKLNLDLTDFGRKNWFSSYAIYFFTWLLILFILVNPPFYDDEKPIVNIVILPEMQEFGQPVLIVAKITDNTEIKKSDISFFIDNEKISSDYYEFENNIFRYTYINEEINKETTISYKISVKDRSSHITEKNGTFIFSNNTIFVPDPLDVNFPPGPRVGSATSIKFKVNTHVTRLYYTINDGNEINVTQKEGDFYITYPKYQGWPRNENVTMKVYAEVNYTFPIRTTQELLQQSKKEEIEYLIKQIEANSFGNKIIDKQTYYFQVADESGVGIETPPAASPVEIQYINVPGFEIMAFIISLGVVVFIFKYRKKNSNKK